MKPSASSSGDNNSNLFSLFFLLVFHSVKGSVSKRDLDSVWVLGFVQGLKAPFLQLKNHLFLFSFSFLYSSFFLVIRFM